jgi:hypothetical protein
MDMELVFPIDHLARLDLLVLRPDLQLNLVLLLGHQPILQLSGLMLRLNMSVMIMLMKRRNNKERFRFF